MTVKKLREILLSYALLYESSKAGKEAKALQRLVDALAPFEARDVSELRGLLARRDGAKVKS